MISETLNILSEDDHGLYDYMIKSCRTSHQSVKNIRIRYNMLDKISDYNIVFDDITRMIVCEPELNNTELITSAYRCLTYTFNLRLFPNILDISSSVVRFNNIHKIDHLRRLTLANTTISQDYLDKINISRIEYLGLDNVRWRNIDDGRVLSSSNLRYLDVRKSDIMLSVSSPVNRMRLDNIQNNTLSLTNIDILDNSLSLTNIDIPDKHGIRYDVKILEYHSCANFIIYLRLYPSLEYLIISDCTNFEINMISYQMMNLDIEITRCTRFNILGNDVLSARDIVIIRSDEYNLSLHPYHPGLDLYNKIISDDSSILYSRDNNWMELINEEVIDIRI